MQTPELILWSTLGAMIGYALFIYGVLRFMGEKPFGSF